LFILSDGWLSYENEISVDMSIRWLSFILTHDARFPFASRTLVVEISLLETVITRLFVQGMVATAAVFSS
jgi:hypothetical protein